MKIKSTTIFLICLLILSRLTVPATACPPPDCGDCYTWNEVTEECDWDCTTGQCCDDGTCVDDCPSGECCDDGTCVDDFPSGECCDDGTCVSSCPSGECCVSGECVTLNTTWVTTGGWTVEVPSWVKTKANAAINSIPGVSGVEVTEGELTATAKQRECCGPPIKHEKCADGEVSLSANLGEIEIYGDSFEFDVHFGSWQATVTITANVTVSGSISATALVGDYDDECGTGCLYGSVSMTASPTITATVGATFKVCLWGACWETGFEASGSATISFTGSARYNQCGNCDGWNGQIKLNSIILAGTVTVASYNGNFSHTVYEDP